MDSHPRITDASRVRYHSLDALRAWAMSMGIVLHAAWIMVPGDSGAPMTDASATWQTDFLLLAIHMFRMQLFFVLAGLFACLLVSKRGAWRFALNRLLRIAFPMVLAWCVLSPLMTYQINLAGLKSGAIQGGLSAWELTREFYLKITYENVMQMHLWFIYHLCWVYVIVLVLRSVFVLVDRGNWLRSGVSALFGNLVARPWAPLFLAAFFVPPMYAMRGPWGVDVEFASLILKWPGVVTYLMYFMAGWLIFRNVHRLGSIVANWRWQLAVGLLLTMPYYFYEKFAVRNGYSGWNYPLLVMEDLHFDFERKIQKYPELRAALVTSSPGSIAHAVWQNLPDANKKFVEQHDRATANQINGLLQGINLAVLSKPKVTENLDIASIKFSPAASTVAKIAHQQRTKKQNELLNREIIETGFPGIIYSNSVNRPYYVQIRLAYSYLYSLTTWLLIFGFMGLFNTYCQGESRFWRYFSDSSYWMYLAHLPIQFQILLWCGDQPWHWIVKFLVYVIGTLVVLIVSYHFLVRPTWIGWLLNGKMVSWRKRNSRAVKAESLVVVAR